MRVLRQEISVCVKRLLVPSRTSQHSLLGIIRLSPDKHRFFTCELRAWKRVSFLHFAINDDHCGDLGNLWRRAVRAVELLSSSSAGWPAIPQRNGTGRCLLACGHPNGEKLKARLNAVKSVHRTALLDRYLQVADADPSVEAPPAGITLTESCCSLAKQSHASGTGQMSNCTDLARPNISHEFQWYPVRIEGLWPISACHD